MRKITLVFMCLILLGALLNAAEQPWKPDALFWTLAAVNVAASYADFSMTWGLVRSGRALEANPIAAYLFNTCPWAAWFYPAIVDLLIIGECYLLSRLGWKPSGYITLGMAAGIKGLAITVNIGTIGRLK